VPFDDTFNIPLFSPLLYTFFVCHPHTYNFSLPPTRFESVQQILDNLAHHADSYLEPGAYGFERLFGIPDSLCKELCAMRAAPPEATDWGSCFWKGRAFCVRGKEARHLDLLRGEDVERKQVSERALCMLE